MQRLDVTNARPDDQRFADVYASCYDRVYAYAARRLGAHAAEDVAAETFTIAWRRIEDLPAEPLPWLYGVARRIVLRQRASFARQEAIRVALEAELPTADSALDGDDGLWQAWLQLSAGDQEVLALIAWDELSVREAAAALNCRPAVFSVRLHRARKRFESLLRSRQPESQPVPSLSEVS